MNAIRRIGEVEAKLDLKEKRQVEIVYIEADEDHVALQNGGNILAKVIYVHEGKTEVNRGRQELRNVRYISGAAESSEDLWLKVADYLEAAYDTKVIRKVFISGDGHGWIREGLNWIDKSVFVLDRFHLAKYIRKATAHMEYARESLWGYVERGMSRAVGDLLDILANEAERGHKQQEVREAKRYIFNHWEAIQRQKSREYVGCSAEGHVSHVLSARCSSRPMGWSVMGLDLMVKMRAFQFNGGNLYDFVRAQKKNQEKDKRIQRMDQRVLRQARKAIDETLGNLAAVNFGKRTGTMILLKAYRS
jgi:F0F1-type ATP synthase epsilon subunit